MASRDTLIAEVGAAVAIFGLLLVFLPLFLDAVVEAQGTLPPRAYRARIVRSWLVPIAIALAATDSTLGIVSLWGHPAAAKPTAILLIVTIWLVLGLAVIAVSTVG